MSFDPDVAQRLWAESGHSTGEEHEIIYYQYGVANTNNVQAAANDLRNNLGIEVSVNRAADIGTFYTAIGYLAPPHQQFSSMTLYVQGPRAAPSAWAGNLLGQGAANLEDREQSDPGRLGRRVEDRHRRGADQGDHSRVLRGGHQ